MRRALCARLGSVVDRGASALAAAPAVLPAAGVLCGVGFGREAIFLPPGLPVALVLLGVALRAGGRRGTTEERGVRWLGAAGLTIAAFAVGALSGHLRGAPPRRPPGPDRPVTAVVEAVGHWRRLDEVWSAPVRIVRLRQGERILDGDSSLEPLYLHVTAERAPGSIGVRLRVRGYLDRPVPPGNPTARGRPPPGPWRLRVKSERLVTLEAPPAPVDRLAAAIRARAESVLRADRPGGSGAEAGRRGLGVAFARAFVLGDAGALPPDLRRALRRLGLAHLLAVSGLHVGLVAGVAFLFAAPLPAPVRWTAGLFAAGLYLLLVGPRPSLVRASTMVCLAVAALLVHRPPSARNALAVAAAAIALARPLAVSELGFQLSVGATAGLLFLAPWLGARWSSLRPRWLREALAVSTAAQLGTLPWALPVFCLVVPAAPFVNLVAVPWAAVALTASIAWTASGCVAAEVPAASGLVEALVPVLDAWASPASWLPRLPPSPWVSLPLGLGAGPAALVALFVAGALSLPRLGLPLLVLALAAAVLAPAGSPDRAAAELVMIDVGQGDALLLRGGGRTLLVDGGGWPAGDLGGRVLLPALARLGVRELDRMLLTHPDRDHCGGLIEIAGYLAVGEVWSGPATGPPPSAGCLAALDRLPGVRRRTATAGERLKVGPWRIEVLHPSGDETSLPGDNDRSVVLAARAHGRCVLLTGDVEAAGERALLARFGGTREDRTALDCDVLKVAHHGSRSSTTPALVAAVAPELALISAGARNPYGHPAGPILRRLGRAGARVLRTDRDGMVVLRFTPDGRWRIDLPRPL